MNTGILMLDLQSGYLNREEIDRIQQPYVAGVILFSRNYENINQLKQLVASIRTLREDLIIAVDQEGGRVQRFRNEFSSLPAMRDFGELYAHNADFALQAAQEIGWLMAIELRAVDIDISFAPVLDIDWQRSQVIGNRAFASDIQPIIQLSSAFMAGMHEAGMASTGKHFPGHGWAIEDSHVDFVKDERDYDTLLNNDLQPFAALIKQGLSAVMPAHIVYSQIDPNPAGFSPYWLQEVLRKQLGFDGVIFSDDLSMAAAGFAGDAIARSQHALKAGCDVLLACNQPLQSQEILSWLQQHNPVSSGRVNRLRGQAYSQCFHADRLAQAKSILHSLSE